MAASKTPSIRKRTSAPTARRHTAPAKRLKQFPERHKGIFTAQAVLLLCKKLGISEKEIRGLNVRALRHGRDTAARFRRKVAALRPNHDDLVERVERLPRSAAYGQLHTAGMPAGSMRVEFANPFGFAKLDIEGAGDGLLETAIWDRTGAQFNLQFIPPATGLYLVEAPFFAVGSYFVIADDGPCNDKRAQLGCDVYLVVLQGDAALPATGGSPISWIIQKDVTNESILDNVSFGDRLATDLTPLTQGVVATVQVNFIINEYVNGGGSIASANFDRPVGEIWCPWADISWIPS